MTLAFTASESNYHYVTSAAISSDPAKPNWRKSATKLVDKIIIKCCGVYNIWTIFRYPFSHIYCKTMFCTTNCMKPAVIDGAIAKHFSDIQFHIYIAKSCFVLPIAWSCYWWDFCQQFFRYGDEPSGGFSSPQLKNPIPKKIKPDSLLFESRWFCHYLYFLFDPIIKNLNRKYSFIKQKLLHMEMKTKTFKVLFSLG